MIDENERECIYLAVYEEVKLLKNIEDRPLYDKHELELLVRVNALTEAILHEVITTTDSKRMIRAYIESLKTPPLPPEPPPPPEGTIKF